MSSGFKTTSQCFWQEQPWKATSAAKWGDGLAERTGTIPNSHTAFPGFITPGRCLYLTRTGLWLPVFKYYCPSGPRHACHLKQIITCSSTLLCFKTCKKSVLCLLDSKWRCMIPVPAVSQELCWLLPPCKLESEELIFTKHTPSLSSSVFLLLPLACFFGLHWRLVLQRISWCTQPPSTWTVAAPASPSVTAGTPCRRCSTMEQIHSAVLDSNGGTSWLMGSY